MPGYLLNSYCHETLDAVADQITSVLVFPDGWSPDGSYNTFSSPDFVRFNIGSATERDFYPPECSSPGPLPYLVGDLADYSSLWAAGLLVIIIAWGARMAKRALGGR